MASLLEEFFILFSSNADELKKGTEEAEKATDDLEDAIGDTDETAVELSDTLVEMAGQAKKAAVAFLALYAVRASKERVLSLTAEADALGKFSARLNENVEEISAWGGAATRSGGSAQAFRSSIESLNEKIVDTAIKGSGELLPFFNQMGISLVDVNGRARSTLDILPELSDAFKNLSSQESAGIGRRLGLDEGTILLLQKGNTEIDRLLERQRELGVVTEEETKAAAEFNDTLADLMQSFNTITRMILIDVVPFLTFLLDKFTDIILFFKENKAFGLAFFGAIAAIITRVYLPAIAAAAVATWAAITPYLLMAAAVTAVAAAFALAVDDVYNFFQGNDSALGSLTGQWESFADTIKGLFNDLKGYYNDFVNGLPDIGIDSLLSIAGQLISSSANSSINTQTPNTISNNSQRGGDKNVTFSGGINVDARGGGDDGTGRATGQAVNDQVRRAVDYFDDGILA